MLQTTAKREAIAILLHDLRGGGAERACLRLAGGMVEEGRAVDLVLVHREGAYEKDIPPGVNVVELGSKRVSSAIFPFARYLRSHRPRAVLSALTHVNLLALFARRFSGVRSRLVISERNQISEKAKAASSSRQRALYRAVPFVYRSADAVVAVSQGVADDLTSFGRLPGAKVHVIHNPVFDTTLQARSEEPVNHPWFAQDIPVLLAVGRMNPQKGFDVLLRAFAKLRCQRDCRLVFLGEGEEEQRLRALSRELLVADHVSFAGFAPNPFAYMARASAFVLSSRWEGFPNALVEAMACGAPVVAADCPSGPREILEGGRFGPLVPVGDAGAMADALNSVLAAKPNTEASRARARGFSIAAAARRYLDILEA